MAATKSSNVSLPELDNRDYREVLNDHRVTLVHDLMVNESLYSHIRQYRLIDTDTCRQIKTKELLPSDQAARVVDEVEGRADRRYFYTFLWVLRDTTQEHLVQLLYPDIELPPRPTLNPHIEDITTLRSVLTEHVTSRLKKVKVRPWDYDTMKQPFDEVYFPLQLSHVTYDIHCSKMKKDLQGFDQVFTNINKRVVVCGAGEVGKSMSVDKLTYDWARDRGPLHGYGFVFPIRLNTLRSDEDLIDYVFVNFLPKLNIEKYKQSLRRFIKDHPDKILFILDGFDEVTEVQKCVHQVFSEHLYPDVTCLLTTREWREGGINGDVDMIVEIEGIKDEEKLERFLSSRSVQDKLDLVKFLEEEYRSGMIDMLRIPLLALICVAIWKENGKGLPKSMTLLFLDILKVFAAHFLSKVERGEVDQDDNESVCWSKCMGETSLSELLAIFPQMEVSKKLGKLSFLSKFEDHSCTQEQLKKNIGEVGFRVGFLQRVEKCRPVRTIFVHRLFQDFFAAAYIVSIAISEDEDDVRRVQSVQELGSWPDVRNHEMFLRFISGFSVDIGIEIYRATDRSVDQVYASCPKVDHPVLHETLNPEQGNMLLNLFTELCEPMKESNNKELLNKFKKCLAQSIHILNVISPRNKDKFDQFCSIIKRSELPERVRFKFGGVPISDLSYLPHENIHSLTLCSTDSRVVLASGPMPENNSVFTKQTILKDMLKLQKLTYLAWLSIHSIPVCGEQTIKSFCEALKCLPKLKALALQHTALNKDTARLLSTCISDLSWFNVELDLVGPGVEALVEGCGTSMETISMRFCRPTQKALDMLKDKISSLPNLDALHIVESCLASRVEVRLPRYTECPGFYEGLERLALINVCTSDCLTDYIYTAHFPNLTVLTLGNGLELTKDFSTFIVLKCPSLEKLLVSRNKIETDVKHILQICCNNREKDLYVDILDSDPGSRFLVTSIAGLKWMQ